MAFPPRNKKDAQLPSKNIITFKDRLPGKNEMGNNYL